jgi:flagellar biosynthetic protein FliQ
MTETTVIDLARQAMLVSAQLAGPALALTLLAGVIVSVFQAITQIQEMTLTFIPKVIAAALGVLLFGPWMLESLINFTSRLFCDLPYLAR